MLSPDDSNRIVNTTFSLDRVKKNIVRLLRAKIDQVRNYLKCKVQQIAIIATLWITISRYNDLRKLNSIQGCCSCSGFRPSLYYLGGSSKHTHVVTRALDSC
jgi:hypothetical protein